jgi:hypothetical protein
VNTVLCDAATANSAIKGIGFIEDLFYRLLTVSEKIVLKMRNDFKRSMDHTTL